MAEAPGGGAPPKGRKRSGGAREPSEADERRRGGKDLTMMRRAAPTAEAPKSGKPRSMMGMRRERKQPSKRLAAATAAAAASDTYLSQISDDANAIKIKIRKACPRVQVSLLARKPRGAGAAPAPAPAPIVGAPAPAPGDAKRKRNASPASRSSSGEEYDPSPAPPPAAKQRVPRPRPPRPRDRGKAGRRSVAPKVDPPVPEPAPIPQSPWGALIPEELLFAVFKRVVSSEGSLPALVNFGGVCKLWNAVSKMPALWSAVELSHHTRDKWKTDHRLVWLLENRLSMCQQLNLGNWKVSNLAWAITAIVQSCPCLRELNLSGWKRLTGDQLHELARGLQKLARIDLSSTSETGSSASCLSISSLTQVSQIMGGRLTHLTLANNKLTGLPAILLSIAMHCPNLELLDLSNLAAVSHPATIPLERLQKGCPKLRVLRITNSQVVLATATAQEQVESPGFPLLEELSVACPSTDYKLVDDEALGRLLKTSNCLRLLDVRGCIRITDSGLIKVPAWDLQHLFLSGCCVTRSSSSCLELICEKWSHSLLEVDLAWSTAARPLDAAVDALAEKGSNSVLKILNLCGSSVSFDPVKRILLKCPNLESVNLASCRALPRGMKRLYVGKDLDDLKDSFDPVKKKKKEDELAEKKKNKQKLAEKKKADKNANEDGKNSIKEDDLKSPKDEGVASESEKDETSIKSPASAVSSPALTQATASVRSVEQDDSPRSLGVSPAANKGSEQFSPQQSSSPVVNKGSTSAHEQFSPQRSSSSVSTPRSNHMQDYSPVARAGASEVASGSNQYDSDSRQDVAKSSSNWNFGRYSPAAKQDGPTSTHPSPDAGSPVVNNNKQDMQKPSASWNFGHFSPSVGRHDNSPYSSQRSPYPSNASPDVGQSVPKASQQGQGGWNLEKFSPVLRHESACSSQPSPETGQVASRTGPGNWNLERFSPMQSNAAQPSPDASQVTSSGKPSGQWNLDRFSPMARAESSPAAVPSPETAMSGVKSGHWSLGHFSPMPRPETSPAPQPSPETPGPPPPKSAWNLGHFSPMNRQEASPVGRQPSPGSVQSAPKHLHGNWNLGQFSPLSKVDSSSGSQRLVQSEIPNMWDTHARYSLCESNVKSDSERTGNCFANVDQVTTTTYCSVNNPGMFAGFSDPLNGPSSVE